MRAGGYGSEDSDAYIPLMKSTLQTEVTSRSARPAADHQQGAQNAGDVSHLAGASSKPAQEDTHLSIAVPSGGAATVAHHSFSAKDHFNGAEADTETTRHVNGSKPQHMVGSKQLLSAEGDDVQASTGQGGKKRKSKGRKGKSRAAKRQAQHDEKAEATAEQDRDPGSPEPIPGSYTEQSLSDLREAALTWAQKARKTPD